MSSVAFTTGRFTVESFGNGWAYTITDESGRSFFVQDESASQLQEDTNDFESMEVLSEYMDTLGEDE